MLLNYISFGIIITSFLGITSGIIGMLRFKDFFSKQHAASVIDCSINLALFGLALLQTNIVYSLKLIFIILLVLLLNPLASYMLANTNYADLD